VVVMGPTGGYLEYFYNEGVWMIEDMDGLRIYSSTACEFIQKVAGIYLSPSCLQVVDVKM